MGDPRDTPAGGDDRFEMQRKLGVGAVGAVYRVLDRERNAIVALKTLRLMDAAAIYRFKREFRSLANLAHKNLVKLYELSFAEDSWFFTMECVDGYNFRQWVRPSDDDGKIVAFDPTYADGRPPTQPTRVVRSGALDDARLRSALAQLARGLDYLHRAGKLHRDIKPSNVLVDGDDGRVVVCDFGLVTESAPRSYNATVDQRVVGTPSYMSPEQAAAEPPTEASDWYSVGVMIYEALTGHVPFARGNPHEGGPVPPRELDPNAPADLSELCMALLRPHRDDRPSSEDILRALGVERRVSERPPVDAPDAPFVGREAQLSALEEAFHTVRHGEPKVALVHGPSGMGKTALVRRFLDSLAAREDTIVLEGRCYEQESVPYKAFDTIIDAVTRQLMRLPEEQAEDAMPRDILALARLFPVLRRVDAVSLPRAPALEPADPQESRRRAFRALKQLLGNLGERRTLVISIDDLQWGDADSALLLADLLRPPDAPRIFLIASYRSEDASANPFLGQFLPDHDDAIDVAVERLSPDESETLVRNLLGDGVRDSATLSAAIQAESDGNPFLLTELVWFAARRGPGDAALSDTRITVDEMVERRLDALPPEARLLLQAVAVAGRPIRQATAKAAAELTHDPDAALVMLRNGRLLRSQGVREGDTVECYHDRIRETVVAHMSASALRNWHQRLAVALEASDDPDREALALHYRDAGDLERAARYAAQAAAQAANALAFDRAANLYRFAIDLYPAQQRELTRLRERLADALVHGGRGAEAAEAYMIAAEGAYAAEALQYQRLAAQQLLIKGHVDEGLRVMSLVLGAMGMKLAPTPMRALLSLLYRRARLRLRGLKFEPRDPSQITAEELGRVDACWYVGTGLGMVDTLRGMDYQARHVGLALDAGDPVRIARALATEAMYVSTAGYRIGKHSGELIARARAIADETGDPSVIAYVTGGDGLREYQLGEFREGNRKANEAIQMFHDRCTGVTWELDTAELVRLWCLNYLGELRELSVRVPALIRVARERGDLFAETSMSTGLPNTVWLVAGDVAGARGAADGTMGRWSNIGWHLQHYWQLIAHAQADLYEAAGDRAFERLRASWKSLRRSLYLRIAAVRVEAYHLRARAALCAAAADPKRRRSLLAAARRDARRLDRQHIRWAIGSATAVRAGIADIAGDDEAARTLYARAEQQLVEADMAIYAAAVRRRRGELLAGDEGGHLVSDADAEMRAQDIADPVRFARMITPVRV
jgi:hypothetical protein